MSETLSERLARIAEEAEAAEADQTDRPLPAHVKVSRPGHARSKVLQVRLNPDEMAALEAIAQLRELPVSTVAREQILRLIAAHTSQADTWEKLTKLFLAAKQVEEYADDLQHELPMLRSVSMHGFPPIGEETTKAANKHPSEV